MERKKPSTFFRKNEWAHPVTLKVADELGITLAPLDEEDAYSIDMPGTVDGTGNMVKVHGYGAYVVLEMIVTAYHKGLLKGANIDP
jgi:hypothetical protein